MVVEATCLESPSDSPGDTDRGRDQHEGYVRLSLPHDDSLTNPGSDVVQGGVVATLIDHAGGAAIRATLDAPLETDHASTELNVSFVQPADGDLTTVAEVVRVGGSMGVVSVGSIPDAMDSYSVERTTKNLPPVSHLPARSDGPAASPAVFSPRSASAISPRSP